MSGFVALHSKQALRIHTSLGRFLPSATCPAKQPFTPLLATRHGRPPSQAFSLASRTPKLHHRSSDAIVMGKKRDYSTMAASSRAAQEHSQQPSLDDVDKVLAMSDSPLSDAPDNVETPPSSGAKRLSTRSTRASKNAPELLDPEANADVPADVEEVKEALSRPPPVNSSYLPLPWKGRLGYACLNTYLRTSTPPVFSARTCRISSILENRHPLQDSSQPPHRTKNRPDTSQPADVERGLAYVQAIGLANARDVIKMLRWNDRYGIKFMRLSSEMFPFASHAEHGYKLEPFAADVLAEAGKVAAELGHRLTTHPGQFTQLASPRSTVIENSIRDLEYHAEMLRLLKLPPQQDRDAVMILHMGGVFGDKQATLDRFRGNYKLLSQDIKNRLVLENDDVSWTVHDLLPICEELNIPLVLDYHHHNINFDADKIREGTLDIMNLYDRIAATWTRKNITQKMHYSEPTPSAITRRQRRKHNPRVQMLPPCDPTMDLMIEAKDKEQAVFELMRTYKLPGFEKINDIIPFTRTDDNKVKKNGKKKGTPKKKKKAAAAESDNNDNDNNDEELAPKVIPEEEVGMGGPEGRVYWPPGMEHWLQPEKRATKSEVAETIVAKVGSGSSSGASTPVRKRGRPARNGNGNGDDEVAGRGKAAEEVEAVTPKRRRTKKKAEPVPAFSSSSEDETVVAADGNQATPKTPTRASRRTGRKKIDYAESEPVCYTPILTTRTLAPPPPSRSRLPPVKPGPRLPSATLSFLRYLFPHTRRLLQARLLDFRHETLPAFRQRTHLRLYRAFVNRQNRARRHPWLHRDYAASTSVTTSGKRGKTGLLSFLLSQTKRPTAARKGIDFRPNRVGRTRPRFTFDYHRTSSALSAVSRRVKDAGERARMTTPQSGPLGPYRADSASDASYGGYAQEGGPRERGTRRKKVYGYLKAANELRQAYSAQWAQRSQEYDEDNGVGNAPGGFPEMETARFADEEMVLFPSYGRRHVRRKPEVDYRDLLKPEPSSYADEDPDEIRAMGDYEHWRAEWERYEADNAVVDVDVRGWIYAPHRGPMNRKNRILIALARRLSGIPAPNTVTTTGENRPVQPGGNEEAAVERQEQSILGRGQSEADPEWRTNGRREHRGGAAEGEQNSGFNDQDEISAANAQLMERLQPFLTNPIISVPITVFFFDDKKSQSRTVSTNDAGHFSIRAALDFVPTHIRVLASENLSATEEVKIIEPNGISLISDIDDTIKHSAIASGAKEIFRNTFVRNLGDLTVLGVKEWYGRLADMGVRIHYVSNAPWQLYPLLKSFFGLAGLPPGSFHLKQYTGMLQGIFEPTAEKKRPTLERIMRDFPDRRFILVGDSGEADLEIYTDLVLANPGKILGVFIRDVTTPHTSQFFDKSFTHFDRSPSRTPSNDALPPPLPERSAGEPGGRPPNLPPRTYLERKEPERDEVDSALGELIGLSMEEEHSQTNNVTEAKASTGNRQAPPMRPSKPAALQSKAVDADGDKDASSIRRKPAPPLPDKPRSLSSTQNQGQADSSSTSLRPAQTFHATAGGPPPPPARSSTSQPSYENQPSGNEESYASAVRNKVANIYNQFPSARSYWESTPTLSSTSSSEAPPPRTIKQQPPPVPPPRRSANQPSTKPPPQSQSLTPSPSPTPTPQPPRPATDAQASLFSLPSLTSSSTSLSTSSSPAPAPLPNKREEMWRRRWARAKEILERQGIVLRSWRVGEDVGDVCVGLVERAEREAEG